MGFWFFGIVALVWAIDHIGVLFICFPQKGPLWKAFSIKRTDSACHLNVDIHRAGGLFFWVILLMLAITGASWNATFFGKNGVRDPVAWFSPISLYPLDTLDALDTPLTDPAIPSDAARDIFIGAMTGAGYPLPSVESADVYYHTTKGACAQIGPFGTQYLEAAVDGTTGAVLATLDPKDYSAGDVFNNWMFPLHSGQAFGLIGRIIICLAGIFTCTVCVAGLVIYPKKQRSRRAQNARRATAPRAQRVK